MVNKEVMWNRSKIIHQEGLTTLGVSFTEAELDLHTKFLYCVPNLFTAPGKLSELERWLTKVYRVVRTRKPDMDCRNLRKLLFENWIAICFNARHFKKLLFTELAFISPLDYYPIFFKKIAKRIL